MDKQTLSHYGWIVIVVLVLAVMLAFATPFGTYVGDAVVATTKGFGSITEHNLNEDNIKNQGDKWEDKFENGVGGGTSEPESPTQPEEPSENRVPEGGTYYVGITSKIPGDYSSATATYMAGQAFPDTVNNGDVFVYGDYEYRYNMHCTTNWYLSAEQNGWGVGILDDSKTQYGEIISIINDKPITSMYSTFMGCTSLTVAPEIPNNVTNMGQTFLNCKKLTTAPAIPNSVTNMWNTFMGCTSLKTAPKIPSNVTDMGQTFCNCTSLKIAPAIPNSVTDMCKTFMGCTSLTTPPPEIPKNVTDMQSTFLGCTNLTGTITVNAPSLTNYSSAFYKTTKPITLTGTSPYLYELAGTANNGNVTVSRRDHTGGGY